MWQLQSLAASSGRDLETLAGRLYPHASLKRLRFILNCVSGVITTGIGPALQNPPRNDALQRASACESPTTSGGIWLMPPPSDGMRFSRPAFTCGL